MATKSVFHWTKNGFFSKLFFKGTYCKLLEVRQANIIMGCLAGYENLMFVKFRFTIGLDSFKAI